MCSYSLGNRSCYVVQTGSSPAILSQLPSQVLELQGCVTSPGSFFHFNLLKYKLRCSKKQSLFPFHKYTTQRIQQKILCTTRYIKVQFVCVCGGVHTHARMYVFKGGRDRKEINGSLQTSKLIYSGLFISLL